MMASRRPQDHGLTPRHRRSAPSPTDHERMSERSTAGRRPGSRRSVAALLALTCIVLAVHPLWLVLHLGGDRATTLDDDLMPVAAATLAVVLTARRSLLAADRTTRLG